MQEDIAEVDDPLLTLGSGEGLCRVEGGEFLKVYDLVLLE